MADIIASWEDARGNTLSLGKSGTISTRGVADLSDDQLLDLHNLLSQIVTRRARVAIAACGNDTTDD